MKSLEGKASFTEQDREQRYLDALDEDFNVASGVLDMSREDLVKDVKDNTGGWKMFGVIPTPLDSDINVDDTKQYLKSKVAGKITSEYQKFIDEGGIPTPEDEDFINGIKQDFNPDETIFDRVKAGAGDAIDGIGSFLDTAKTAVSTDEGRKTLTGTITSAFESGVNDPAGFFDALATLSADAVVDQIPTGIFKTAKDISGTISGQAPVNDVSMNVIKGSPISGQTTEQLAKDQPAAAFISFIVPYVLAGGWKKVTKANNLEKALTSATGNKAIAGAVDLAVGETVFDAASSSVNTAGDTIAERNKARGANAILTFFSGLGIDLAGGGLNKIYKGFAKELPKDEALKATVKTVREKLSSVVKGETPISLKSINDHIEAYGVPTEEAVSKVPDSPVLKMTKAQIQKHIESGAALEDLKAYGLPESEATAQVEKAVIALSKNPQKILTAAEKRDLLNEVRAHLTKSVDTIEPSVMPGSVDEAVAKATPVEERKGLDAAIAKEQEVRKSDLTTEADSNAESAEEFKEELIDDTMDELDADSSLLPEDQPGIPFDGNSFDLHARALTKTGFATPGFLMSQSQRFRTAMMAYVSAHSWSGRMIRGAYEEGYKIKDVVGKMVGLNADKFTDKYLKSGYYRAWAEGMEVPLSDAEKEAFTKLKELDADYNTRYNLPIIEETGRDTKNFNPEAFTDSSRGNKTITLDASDPTLRAEIEQAGYQVTDIAPTKSNPKLKTRSFVFIDFGRSGNEIINNLNGGKFYYQQKAPFLFDEAGNLKVDLLNVEHNPTKELFELANERTITPDQIAGISQKLVEAGYDPASVAQLKNSIIANGGVDTTVFRSKANKVFEGSLQNKVNSKIGVNLDVVQARVQQNVRLSKKVFKDVMSDAVAEQKQKLTKELLNDIPDQKRVAYNAEKHALDWFHDTYVMNKPGVVEKAILTAVDVMTDVKNTTVKAIKDSPIGENKVTKLSTDWLENMTDGKSAFQTLRDWSDQHLAIQSVLKLSGNISGGLANVFEALTSSANVAIDMPDKYWKTLFDATAKNPLKFVKDVESRMESSVYKNFYLDNHYDTSVDTRFLGKRTLAKKFTDNPISNATMAPFTGSIRWGKSFVYSLFDQVGQAKGLTSYELEDFIFEQMTKRGQVGELNTPMIAKNDFTLKSLLFLKNFMFVTSEYETNAWTRAIGSTIGGKPDKEAIKEMLAFTGTRTLLFGAQASPTVSLINHAIGNPMQAVKAKAEEDSVSGGLANIGAYGVVGAATGLSTEQLHIDALSGLNNTPIAINTAKNAAEWFATSGDGIQMLAAGKTRDGVKVLAAGLDNLVRKESTMAGRAAKAYNVATTGELRTTNGSLVQKNVNRPAVALQAVLGFNPGVVDQDYALEQEVNQTLQKEQDEEKRLMKTFTKLNGDEAGFSLFEVKGKYPSDSKLEKALDNNAMTRVERLQESLSEQEIEDLKDNNPEAYDILYGDSEIDDGVNKYEQ